MSALSIIFIPVAVIGMIVAIVVSSRLKYHIDRNALLNMEDLSKLYAGSGPPKSILTPRGMMIHKLFIFAFVASISSMAILAIANFHGKQSAQSLFMRDSDLDCPDSTRTICQNFLMKGNSNKCAVKELEYLLTPKRGLLISSINKYFNSNESCDSLDGKAICTFNIADNVNIIAESKGATISDARILSIKSPKVPEDSNVIIGLANLSDSTYKYVLTGLLLKYGIEGVNERKLVENNTAKP